MSKMGKDSDGFAFVVVSIPAVLVVAEDKRSLMKHNC